MVFWPRLSGREPDLLVALGRSGDDVDLLVLVEAKLHSDQHWIEGRSQLGFYGELLFDEDAVVELFEDLELPEHRPLVYLTKGADAPTTALVHARNELSDRVADGQTEVFWTSWHRAREVASAALAEALEVGQPAHVQSLLSDLLEDLAERGFRPPRPRAAWPMPPLRRLESGQAEAWLCPPAAPAPPGPTIRQLERAELPSIDAFLREWSLR